MTKIHWRSTRKGDLIWSEGLAVNGREKLRSAVDSSLGVVGGMDKVTRPGVIAKTEHGVLHVVDVEYENDISTGCSGDDRVHGGELVVHCSGW